MTTRLAGLPRGFRIALDRQTTAIDDSTILGGSPRRLLRMSPAGRDALDRLRANPIDGAAEARLARTLTDAGLAHPVPPVGPSTLDVTIVIPVHGRAALLDGCLAAAGRDHPVVVVDDGSAEPAALAAVAARHGATLVRRDVNGGPAAARNSGLEHAGSEVIAFLDSDCVPPPQWISSLVTHFADPLVGAVAPRIRPVSGRRLTDAYACANGSLDLGPDPALVTPCTPVAYVPSAALLVRRSALALAPGRDVFDPSMRVGEDVDLIWRLVEAGWRIRYDPSVEVAHHEPSTWRSVLRRRFRYGTSAGALARRHPSAMAPAVLPAWPLVAVAGVLLRRRSLVALGIGGTAVMTRRARCRAGLADGHPRVAAEVLWRSWTATGRYLTQFAGPLVAAAILSRTAPPGRRATLAALVLADPVQQWVTRRPVMHGVTYVAARIADDLAYGAGVWVGATRARSTIAITPLLWGVRAPRPYLQEQS